MSGILYGVGVGPGDPELLTIKALRILKESDIIALPAQEKEHCHAYQIVKQSYPEMEEKELLPLSFPMTKDAALLQKHHEENAERILQQLRQGKQVAFLTIGDPCVYSTFQYMYGRIKAAGEKAYVINGVPSFCAAAGAAGISLADMPEEIHIIPASYDIKDTMELRGTRVYMKSGKKLAQLKVLLTEQAKTTKLQVIVAENCGMENERIHTGLDAIDPQAGYLTIVIVKEEQ